MDHEQTSIARLKAGDIDGLEALVEMYQVRAVRTAYLIVRDLPLAEDITQSAFIRAYERIGQFDPDASFGPWFLRSVANDARKAVERSRRTRPLDDDSDDRTPGTEIVDPSAGPAALLEQAEDAAAVWAMLGRLSPEQRTTVVLRYFVGLTDAEIAGRLDIPGATVRWRLFAARQRMRSWLGARAD